MSFNPLVSVIIPAYNSGGLLTQAIDSALAQTYPNLEIVVIDDGSTDDTPALLAQYKNRITTIRQKNAGTPAARNTGIRHSTGDLIAFLDQDDLWDPTKLHHQVPLFADPAVALVPAGGRVLCATDVTLIPATIQKITLKPAVSDGAGQCASASCAAENSARLPSLPEITATPDTAPTSRITSEFLPEPELSFHDLLAWCKIACATAVFRRSALLSLKGGPLLDESLPGADDWDLWIRLAANHRVLGCRQILATIREHQSNQSRKLDRMYAVILRVINKHQNFHPNCPDCRRATRHARARLRQDYYVKACRRSSSALHEGRPLESLTLRLKALTKNPAAAKKFPHRLLQQVTRASRPHPPNAAVPPAS